MAKKNFEEAEAQVANPVVETPETEGTQEQGAKPKKENEAAVNTTVKTVKIRITEEVNCFIGGTPYQFAKGKEVNVPTDVAAILTNSQKAFRV